MKEFDYQRNLATSGEEEMLKILNAAMKIKDNVNSAAFHEAARTRPGTSLLRITDRTSWIEF